MVIFSEEFVLKIIISWLVKTNCSSFSLIDKCITVSSSNNLIVLYNSVKVVVVKIWVRDKQDEAVVVQIMLDSGISNSDNADFIRYTIDILLGVCKEIEQELERFYIVKDVHLKI